MANIISKKFINVLSRAGIIWQTVYLISVGNKYLKFFFKTEEAKVNLNLTNDVEDAFIFDDFEKAYWWTYMITSIEEPKDIFVIEAKVKGRGKYKKMLLSEEYYFA